MSIPLSNENNTNAAAPVLVVKRQALRRLKTGHPWIFSNELVTLPKDLEPGRIVDVKTTGGDRVGRGYYNRQSLIAVRLLARKPVEIDADFLDQKIARAQALRERWLPGETAYRLVFSEGDGLPGLIADRYDNLLVVQLLTAGMERLGGPILDVLVRRYRPVAVVARNDAPLRVLEGLAQEKRLLHGELPASVIIQKNQLQFEVDVWEGQKTGYFLDQADNYRSLDGIAAGARVLDVFCYTGAWGLHALRYGARSVLGMDSSGKALRLARANAERNGLGTACSFVEEDAFDGLRRLYGKGERFDLVILDPPAFAKSRQKVKEALRGYKEVNRLAMMLLSPDGILVTCSCSHLVRYEVFRELLASAAADAKRSFRMLAWRSQGRDHPIVLGIPETEYLKCGILQAENA